MEYYLSIKRNELPNHKRTGRSLNAYSEVKEVHSKRLHAIRFQLESILDEANLRVKKWLSEFRGREEEKRG